MVRGIPDEIVGESPDFIAAFDVNLNVVYLNRAFAKEFLRLYGKGVSVGDNLRQLFADLPEGRELIESTTGRALAGESLRLRMEAGLPHRHRGLYEFCLYPIHDDSGSISGVAHVARDVSESSHWMDWALDCAKAGTWVWNLVSGYLEWDAHLYRLLGLDPETIVPSYEGWLEAILAEDRAAVNTALQTGIAERQADFQLDFRIRHPDGVKWLTLFGRLDYDAAGGPERMAGICIDLTGLREAELALTRARDAALRAQAEAERAAQAKSHFLAAVSHDLRQPAQSLTLLSSLLKDRAAGTSFADLAQPIEQAVSALRSLLDGVLDISRLDAGLVEVRNEVTPIGGLMNRVVNQYAARAAEQKLELRRIGSSVFWVTDAALLERILAQLLENALRFTLRGRILVGCRHRPGGRLSIEVVDTGIGIADSERESIFEEFYQVGNLSRDRTLGLGLGLAVVRRLAQLIGATVEVDSVPGRGSRFAILLPPLHSPATGLSEAVYPFAGRRGDDLGLVIEDNDIVRMSMQLMLERWGYLVVTAASGEEAIAVVASGLRPDFVLADIRLGGGMTGIAAVETLRKLCGKAMPALVVTGDTDSDWDSELPAHDLGVVHKPVGADVLRREIVRLLGRGQAEV